MEQDELIIKHSKLNLTSYGFGKFLVEFLNMAFGTYAYFYYESEIGLESWIIGLGFIIFAIWNAINDPLMGYLTNRPFKFTKKWGRRFPWVIIGGIPYIVFYIFIFTPPNVDPGTGAWILFGWFVFSTCLYDTFASLYWVNFAAIFPDKFRSASERHNASTFSTIIAALGTGLGSIIPPLFYTFGAPRSYVNQAVAVVVVCMIALVLSIPGTREDQVRIDCYLESCEEGMERPPFFKELVRSLKHKN